MSTTFQSAENNNTQKKTFDTQCFACAFDNIFTLKSNVDESFKNVRFHGSNGFNKYADVCARLHLKTRFLSASLFVCLFSINV